LPNCQCNSDDSKDENCADDGQGACNEHVARTKDD
jgi:hypothetical protein